MTEKQAATLKSNLKKQKMSGVALNKLRKAEEKASMKHKKAWEAFQTSCINKHEINPAELMILSSKDLNKKLKTMVVKRGLKKTKK